MSKQTFEPVQPAKCPICEQPCRNCSDPGRYGYHIIREGGRVNGLLHYHFIGDSVAAHEWVE